MPLIEQSTYKAPLVVPGSHLQTIIPGLFRKVRPIKYSRFRKETADQDFLDIDIIESATNTSAVIISHGFEGSSERPYVTAMADVFSSNLFDVYAWNFRSCSGEINKQKIFYHSGATYDLDTIVNFVRQRKQYKKIVLVGFSLGGNLTLKYLGEQKFESAKSVSAGITFSVPCHLSDGSKQISKPTNFVYEQRFLRSLQVKMDKKLNTYPEIISRENLKKIKKLIQFDEQITAPLHGFKDAEDYYDKNSAVRFINGVKTPSLIVNAKNDPFLAPACFPYEQARENDHVFLETPVKGGHTGFMLMNKGFDYWMGLRAINFLKEVSVIS